MKSSNYKYRILTQPDNKFKAEYCFLTHDTTWKCICIYESFDEAVAAVKVEAARDNFIPQVLEIPND